MIPSHSFPESTTARRQQQTRMPRRQILAASGAAALAPALAACTGESAAIRSGIDAVTCLTSFGTLGRDAYPFAAKELGYFADERLDVTIEPGAGTTDNLGLLGTQADFAMIDIAGAIIARGQGNSTDHVALAAIHQAAPAALMTTHPDITGAQDLPGRTVALAPGAILELLFPAYAELAGIDPGQVRIEPVDPPNLISVLAAGQVDVIEQFAMGLPTVQAAVGDRQVTVLPYSEFLSDLPGVVLVTTRELAQDQPDLCRRFRDALLHGLDYSLDHPEEAGRILAAQVDTADATVAAAELEIMDSYSRVPGITVGAIDEVRVAQSIALLEGIGAIPAGLTAQDVVDFDLTPAA